MERQRYGNVISGELDIATWICYDPNKGMYHPTDEEYRAMGWKRLIGYYDVSDPDYEDDGMVHELTATADVVVDGKDCISCGYDVYPPDRGRRVFSKMSLELALFKAGLLQAADKFIDSQSITNEQGQTMPLRRLYDTALTFSEDNEYFSQFKAAMQAAVGLSDEQVEAILAASVARQ